MKDAIAQVGSIEIGYDVRGEGPPLLLIPGFGLTRAMWEEDFCDRLSDMGFTVVRMDNRDTGRSTRLDGLGVPDVKRALLRGLFGLSVGTAYPLEAMAADAVGLMSALGHPRFHVLGASMGGMIAQTIALTHAANLASLTSVISTPGGRRYSIADPRTLVALLRPPPQEPARHADHITEVLRVLQGKLPFEEARARTIAEAQVAARPSPAGAVRQFMAIMDSSARRRPLLRRITTPTLILHGSHDPLLPVRGARAMQRLIPGSELIVYEGMGHGLHSSVYPQALESIAVHVRRNA
jgi:pimeloyl-ACP methyl ester carboxylesterase